MIHIPKNFLLTFLLYLLKGVTSQMMSINKEWMDISTHYVGLPCSKEICTWAICEINLMNYGFGAL